MYLFKLDVCGGLPTGFAANTKVNTAVTRQRSGLVLAFLFLGEKDSVDVRENSSLSDGNVSKELIQLLIVSVGELECSGAVKNCNLSQQTV